MPKLLHAPCSEMLGHYYKGTQPKDLEFSHIIHFYFGFVG